MELGFPDQANLNFLNSLIFLNTFEFFESPFGIKIDRIAWECRKNTPGEGI